MTVFSSDCIYLKHRQKLTATSGYGLGLKITTSAGFIRHLD